MSTKKNLFREKSLKKISSPEKLDDYIRVTTPRVWIILIAIIVILSGAVIWGVFGRIPMHKADGTRHEVAPITFILN